MIARKGGKIPLTIDNDVFIKILFVLCTNLHGFVGYKHNQEHENIRFCVFNPSISMKTMTLKKKDVTTNNQQKINA